MAELNMGLAIVQFVPIIKTFLGAVLILGVLGGIAYYLFVIRKRRKWEVRIFEKKADGRDHLIGFDQVIERYIMKGKIKIYTLRRRKHEVFPPSEDCVYRFMSKEYVDYQRIGGESYLPQRQSVDMQFIHNAPKEEKVSFFKKLYQRKKEIKHLTNEQLEQNYLYVPHFRTVSLKNVCTLIEHDLEQLRQNAISNRDILYADKKSFWEQWGGMILLASIGIIFIIVIYMSFGYITDIVNALLSRVDELLKTSYEIARSVGIERTTTPTTPTAPIG